MYHLHDAALFIWELFIKKKIILRVYYKDQSMYLVSFYRRKGFFQLEWNFYERTPPPPYNGHFSELPRCWLYI